MEATFTTIAASALTVVALAMLGWAWRGGQLSDLDRGATSIFDDHEPVGRLTDRFPAKKARKETANRR